MSILAPNRRPISRYQPRARELPPLPPRWRPPAMWEVHRPDIPLWRFVFLSMLLHLLGILLFGALKTEADAAMNWIEYRINGATVETNA